MYLLIIDSTLFSAIIKIFPSLFLLFNWCQVPNVLIVILEEISSITTVIDRQVYNVDTIDNGSQEVLAKINKVENSLSKAYSICKETTIYTSSVVEGTKEQPYLQYIVPTLYQICQKVQQIVSESHAKISTVY